MIESTCDEDPCDVDKIVAEYNTTLRKIIDDHAP